jgi:hypothetical protein
VPIGGENMVEDIGRVKPVTGQQAWQVTFKTLKINLKTGLFLSISCACNSVDFQKFGYALSEPGAVLAVLRGRIHT